MRKTTVFLSLIAVGLIVVAGCNDTSVDSGSKSVSPKGTVQGFVIDAVTNAPVANVTVKLFAAGVQTTRTDANGYWYFVGVPANEEAASLVYTLAAPDADGNGTADYLPMRGTALLDEDVGETSLNEDGLAQNNSLTTVFDYAVKPVTLTGFVTDLATGEGINGATVVLDLSGTFNTVNAVGDANSNASIDVAAQYTATTADHATSGAAGAYTLTVPAATIPAAALGAYADGYEYGAVGDNSSLNLHYVSTAVVDFQLNPIDNNVGLVLAQADLGAGGQDLAILLDASGANPGGPVPVLDLNGATQLVFTLIFDQPIDSTQFFGDTIQLQDNGANVVYANLSPAWGNVYSVTLTADADLQKLNLGAVYTLVTNRAITEDGGGTVIAAATNLASFQVYDSTATAVNPTPALALDGALDTTLAAHNGVYTYDAGQQLAAPVTTAQNYNPVSPRNPKNIIAIGAVEAFTNAVDISWTGTPPYDDLTVATALTVYARESTAAGAEVVHWTDVTPGGGNTLVGGDGLVMVNNLNLAWLGNLRYGNVIDIAVTLMDAQGVETAIDETKLLTLSDAQNPEVQAINNTDYDTVNITFSESMDTNATTTVAASNTAIMSVSPAWVDDGAGNVSLLLDITSAVSATVAQAGTDTITAGGLITFDTAGEADLFWVGQRLLLTYANGLQEELVVAQVDTDGAAPTVQLNAGPAGDINGNVVISISPDTDIRAGSGWIGFVGAAATTTLPLGGTIAVGDTILVRDTAVVNPSVDITATVVDVDTVAGTVTLDQAYDFTGYDAYLFEGDVFTVTAQDEAGNALHADADEIVTGGTIE